MTTVHTEHAFEDAIEIHLLANGWLKLSSGDFDPELGLAPREVLAFIEATQAKAWAKVVSVHGGEEKARHKFFEQLAGEIDQRGALDVLRRPVGIVGQKISLAFFRPAHSLTADLVERYGANRVAVVRQLPSSGASKPLDLAFFVNGLPIATAELKNPFTGQTVRDAIHQYRHDRDPKAPLFARRALVHFAVDPDEVYVTTKLRGPSTRFAPFNQGSNGPGVSGGAGNPARDGYKTAYLWEEVLQRDNWLELLQRFAHVSADESPRPGAKAKSKNVHERELIFPRYHQWDAVRRLVGDAATAGAGQHYLIQHSAGSGKSNTIAWLAHRLANLHTPDDGRELAEGLAPNQKVFSKVIVITDRLVLDRQLQDTIFQFDHVAGVVERIDKDSGQLATALAGEGGQVVITTLQKFPFVLDKLDGLAGSAFAVIVDEAHSSQTGENMKALKTALAATADPKDEDEALAAAEVADAADEEAHDPDEAVVRSVAHRGRQGNLSFFAFTATPKHKTLELFGTTVVTLGAAEPEIRPFHVYSMRQAIEEGYILDPLKNYVTYSTYYKLANAGPDDPELEVKKASHAITRYASLHPSNLAQKAEIIAEHFRRKTRASIGGRAKAMVVTRSRLHAVKYQQAIQAYIAHKGYHDVASLVAFSGSVIDDTGDAELIFTEAAMNGFAETALPKRFAYTAADDPGAGTENAAQDREYGVLVVAEKYQTGYDQPLLTTMFVDKKLEGVKAVQTLSRINRTHPLKAQDDLFVLDFVNDAEDIAESFRPFFETTIAQPTEPSVLYTLKNRVDGQPVIAQDEVNAFVAALLATPPAERMRAHERLYAHTNAAVARFVALTASDAEGAEDFRDALESFCRLYAFLAQVMPFSDTDLEKLYLYGRLLERRLPRRDSGAVDVGELEMTYLRVRDTGALDVSLGEEGDQEIAGFAGGRGSQHEAKKATKSSIIEALNDRFGTAFTEADRLHFEQSVAAAIEDPVIREQALANEEGNFAYGFDPLYEKVLLQRHDLNAVLLQRYLKDPVFREALTDWARAEAYQRIREDVRKTGEAS